MTMPVSAPVAAYRDTDFIVIHDGVEIAVMLDERSAALDRLLERLGASSGIFITAWNPFSELTPLAINHAANERMAALFTERGIHALEHVGRARAGDWHEHGFFALDLDPADALAIARAFNQYAVVHAQHGHPAALLLTEITRL